MKNKKKISRVLLFTFLIGIFFAVSCVLASETIHHPDTKTRQKWEDIEDTLMQKKPKTVEAIDELFKNLVAEENETTILLEQKASTQMGCISIVIAILVATLGLFLKDFSMKFSKTQKMLFLFVSCALIFVFVFSVYWSYKSFAIRANYATYNVEDLLEMMKDSKSDFMTYQIFNVLENYAIYNINSTVNDSKADALLLAAKSFFAGIVMFSILCLGIIVFRTRKEG